MNAHKVPISKPAVSVTEMFAMLELSRSRGYQLLHIGFLPKPLYDLRSKRPFYNEELQRQCIQARQTGIGDNGMLMIFYTPRQKETASKKKRSKKIDPLVEELTDTLHSMGSETTTQQQVQQALKERYPEGISGQDMGVIIRELYRHLKQGK